MTEPEFDGMPPKQIKQAVVYTVKREEMVDSFDRLDVGSVITDLVVRHFEVRKVTKTQIDGIDHYVAVATEIE